VVFALPAGSCGLLTLTLVDVVVPVGFEPRRVEEDARVWTEGT
jgi:hypothetical protein